MIESVNRSKRRPVGAWISAICLFLLLLVATNICTAWGVRRVFLMGTESDSVMTATEKTVVLAAAEFPVTARNAMYTLFNKQLRPLLLRTSDKEQSSWVRQFPFQQDSGYLLLSGLYRNEAATGVKLIRVADGHVMASWSPDWDQILAKISRKKYSDVGPSNITATNPLLLDNADIIFETDNASVRLPACSRQPRWVLDEAMHHSTALDSSGMSYWSPSIEPQGFTKNSFLRTMVRNDAIAKISLDGRLLYRRGFDQILHDNNLDFLLFNGSNAGDANTDPIHLNQIKAAPSDTKYWKKGDLLVSLRSPNTVLLYRPSENKVIWRQTGPWIHQHSADFVNDHQISVFNNNSVLRIAPPTTAAAETNSFDFLTPDSVNEVMVYDFDTNQITQPYKPLLDAARPRSVTQGRARILPDGGLFLEETDNGRILRFSKDKLLWSFVNDYDDKHLGALAWSSYLTAEEARGPLAALKTAGCLSETPAGAPVTGS